MLKFIGNKFLLILYLIIGTCGMTKAETSVGLEVFKINPESSLELTSQSMTFNSSTGKTHFFDDVVVKYGKLKLSAEKLTFAKVEDGDDSNLRFSAFGPVIISSESNFIYGDIAEFTGKTQKLTISGNVSLHQNSNKILGDNLVLDLRNGIAKITGSVTTIINPNGKIQ